MRQHKQAWLSLMIVLSLVLVACGDDTGTETTEASDEVTTTEASEDAPTTEAADETPTTEMSEEMPVVRISALNGGLTGVAAQIVEENGFDEANGYHGEFFYNDPDASGQFFLQRESDVAFDFDAIGAAIARTEGLNVSVFYPILNNNNCILVKEGASYESPEDLIGEPVGHFGADSGTTTSFTIFLQELYGFNLLEDYNLVETGRCDLQLRATQQSRDDTGRRGMHVRTASGRGATGQRLLSSVTNGGVRGLARRESGPGSGRDGLLG
jgi:hypothetical protein